MPSDYLATLNAWRAEMDANLRSDYSWLALWGLFWLDEGKNSIGSAEDSKIRLPERIAPKLGSLVLNNGKVSVALEKSAELRLNDGEVLSTDRILRADVTGNPDFLFADEIRMMLVERGGQLAIRVWEPQHPNRANFSGRQWFNIAENFRVEADIEPYDPPKSVLVDDILGFQQEGQMHASLQFEITGRKQQLDAQKLDSGAYYIIFKDATANQDTYPSGRYLVTEIASGEKKVVIDFNRAYNPPCAFTEHATCPLPRPENMLEVAIEAGEKYLPISKK
jgi:uncharacterized protein (DUF1684 family)